MKMTIRPSFLAMVLVGALLTACGPGTPGNDTDDPPPAPEWAFGWWLTGSGLQEHPEWGVYVLQMEIRADGTVVQLVDYCEGEDWTHQSHWELQPDGAIRIVPNEGDGRVPFQDWTTEYEYVEIRPSNGSCTTTALRVNGEFESVMEIKRGWWCIGEYLPDAGHCPVEQFCGEASPVCG